MRDSVSKLKEAGGKNTSSEKHRDGKDGKSSPLYRGQRALCLKTTRESDHNAEIWLKWFWRWTVHFSRNHSLSPEILMQVVQGPHSEALCLTMPELLLCPPRHMAIDSASRAGAAKGRGSCQLQASREPAVLTLSRTHLPTEAARQEAAEACSHGTTQMMLEPRPRAARRVSVAQATGMCLLRIYDPGHCRW